MKGLSSVKILVYIFAAVLIAGGLFLISRRGQPQVQAPASDGEETIWTCSMHPQIRQPKQGKCPICFMDLIPVSQTRVGERQVEYTEEAIKLMEIATSPVERKQIEIPVRMVGKVDYDESRIRNISAWVPGRIDRLFVDYVGIPVRKGDHLVELYSPELISAQAELLQALQSAGQIDTQSDLIRRSVKGTVEAARDKLRLLGVQPEQIEEIERTGKVMDHLTIYSPIGGVVIEKHANEGAYVETGQMIYMVADLSSVWLLLDAYESDLQWISYGQKVKFTVAAYPGEVFEGTISFIDPFLNPQTRTVKLRVIADNPDGKLKPEMFARAEVRVSPAADGSVSVPQMAGKWICPMHPNVVKDEQGDCDICGMDLVTAESLGIDTTQLEKLPLVIPASAPRDTGERAVVYVKVSDAEIPTFEGREVVLGPRAGDYYIVKSGLEEGDVVVTSGSFNIDADLQIQGKPSMMSPEGGAKPPVHEHGSGEMQESVPAENAQQKEAPSAEIEQKTCPVLGGPIDPDVFIEYKGKKVYFCCPGCDKEFLKNPEKYMDKLPQFQEQTPPEKQEAEHVH